MLPSDCLVAYKELWKWNRRISRRLFLRIEDRLVSFDLAVGRNCGLLLQGLSEIRINEIMTS